jgi:xanthine dehydrogenase accessory factor
MDKSDSSIDIFQKVVEFIDTGESFALATVLKAEGSTPRKAGVRAIIDQAGKIYGTLGGGAVEAQAQQRAIESCLSKKPIIFDIQLQGADRADNEPICGGQMHICIDPTVSKNKAVFLQVAEAVRMRQKGIVLTTLVNAGQTQINYQWFPQDSVPTDIAFPGTEEISSCLVHETPELYENKSEQPEVFTEVFVEPIIPKPLLVIAGGGHIGQALALAAGLVGFDIVVLDDRQEFTNPALFPEGITIRCDNISEQLAAMPVGKDTYVVIVTRGHQNDAEALEVCIHKSAAYVGMIGSKRKVALIRKDFIESGIATSEEFGRVFTPIGLDIGAVTVPEVAASIVAQLIAVRRKGITHIPKEIVQL